MKCALSSGGVEGRERGYSLLELAVAMAVTAVCGLMLWQLLPLSRQVAEGEPQQAQLERVRHALEGFALAQSRLPCPAPDAALGTESCDVPGGASTSVIAAAGWVPWRTLGIAQSDGALKYGVYRVIGADLTLASNQAYVPYLPPYTPTGYTTSTFSPAAISNGLDLCVSLRRAVAAPNASAAGGVGAGGIPVAFVLAAPGPNHQFDGANAAVTPSVAAFALPGRATNAQDDDPVLAVGLSELSSHLTCPGRLGAVSGEARSAFQSYDQWRNMGTFKDFRSFAYRVRQSNTQFAAVNLTLASVRLGVAIANQVSAISLAANSAGVGATDVIGAIAAIGAATGAVGAATVSLGLAVAAEIKAHKQSLGASGLYAEAGLLMDSAVLKAYQSDQKGLLP